ncbi:methyltransferase domain-containing protein [Chryseobacterium sp.]|uniref:methyltransferase domain-containing protein n=1 Tax=Chryseobacterium sp. TaxID=1871047 RepID=UPI0011CA5D56|nr:methyltransferase domain-containing protein [Chryseobacterium sp.]TXF75066.1 class I SAM-dependent methyltransferase [Chryseobacterium sp.]
MEALRKPFQGVKNIVRFNWHFYIIVIVVLLVICVSYFFVSDFFKTILIISIAVILLPVIVSLGVSYYVYDASGLYSLKWINIEIKSDRIRILNINAGFDETSELLTRKFPHSEVNIVDFYDEKKHTEISIKRARKLYPNSSETISVATNDLPFENSSIDLIFLIFSAHEIRNNHERMLFFKELNRVLKQDGFVIITEHIRDIHNFFAYNIGFFHFIPLKIWLQTFNDSNFTVAETLKVNPFVTTYYLTKHGTSS